MIETAQQLDFPTYLLNFPFSLDTTKPNNIWMSEMAPVSRNCLPLNPINSRYTVYKNPYMTENVILMGFRGKQFLETGAVFAPYVPLIMTPLIYDPNTMTPRKGLMTRYAKKMLRPEYYGKIYVNGLTSL